MSSGRGPLRGQEIEELVRSLEPQLIERFQEHEVPPHEAAVLLEEVVTLLLYRWQEIARPRSWLLEMVGRRLAKRDEPES